MNIHKTYIPLNMKQENISTKIHLIIHSTLKLTKILLPIKNKKKNIDTVNLARSKTCEELKKKKRKKNGNPLSRSNFQSKSVAFNIDESHPSSLNLPHFSFETTTTPFAQLCVSQSIHANLSTKKKKNANTRRYALRTTGDLGSGRNKGENWSRSRSRWRNRETDYQCCI